ncbi:Rab13 [Hexamita inflata]|uniref:Rab13 n=1 Tax=Hexamita inflata TaxID=28002 RepID=A0AA86UM50_9EUKA|nr:Rab13 [Hexamita inflata]
MNTSRNIKLIIVGSSRTEKARIYSYLTGNQYEQYFETYGGFDIVPLKKFLQLQDQVTGNIQILDTAGMDRFIQANSDSYRKAQIVLIVFSFSDQDSFDKSQFYTKCIQEYCNAIILLIGTRFADEQIISVDEVIDFAQLNDFQFFELKNDNFDALKTLVQYYNIEY